MNDFEFIREQLLAWNETVDEIGELFNKRETKLAKVPMIEYTNKYISCLFALNHQREKETNELQVISKLERKPLNLSERLGFLLESPNHYHAYIQLKELFIELRKMTARYEIIEKRDK